MYISYDYSELIEELKGEIEEGLIDQEGNLLILRSAEAVDMGEEGPYHPIIDYYSEDFEKSIKSEIAELEREAQNGPSDSDSMLKQSRKLLRLFEKDKKHLERMSVNEVLYEMYEHDRIIR